MTASTTTAPAFAPTGRPVRRFAAAITVVVVVTAAAAATGAGRPAVDVNGSTVDHASTPARAELMLENDGMFAVTVIGAEPRSSEIESVTVDGPVRLEGGGKGTVRLAIATRCGLPDVQPHVIRLEVRTWAGLTRPVTIENGLIDPCP